MARSVPARFGLMYYDDEGRRFNVLSGLLFGTILGAGLAMLMGPQGKIPDPPSPRRIARDWKRRGVRAFGGGRGRALDQVTDTLVEAWRKASTRDR